MADAPETSWRIQLQVDEGLGLRVWDLGFREFSGGELPGGHPYKGLKKGLYGEPRST